MRVLEQLETLDRGYAIFKSENKEEALKAVRERAWEYQHLGYCLRQRFVTLRYPGGDFRLPSRGIEEIMQSTSFPGLYLGQELKIYSPEFLRSLMGLLEQKEISRGLVRLSDNAQLVLTHGSALSMGVSSAQPYTRLKREDYWDAQNLLDFNREWRQQLRDDGTNSIEYSYLALSDPCDRTSGMSKYTTKYSLLVDGSELYHSCETVDKVALVA